MLRKVRIITTIAAVAVLGLSLNSCGGKKTAAPPRNDGFRTVSTPATELEELKRVFEEKNIPSGIGIGTSNQEDIARNVSESQARTNIANSIDVLVQRLMESYAQNVNNEAKTIWEEAVRQITHQHVHGATPYKTFTQENNDGSVRVYTLVILNPELFKAALSEAMARNEEFELRVKKDEMMSRLDANIAEYNDRYRAGAGR